MPSTVERAQAGPAAEAPQRTLWQRQVANHTARWQAPAGRLLPGLVLELDVAQRLEHGAVALEARAEAHHPDPVALLGAHLRTPKTHFRSIHFCQKMSIHFVRKCQRHVIGQHSSVKTCRMKPGISTAAGTRWQVPCKHCPACDKRITYMAARNKHKENWCVCSTHQVAGALHALPCL